ncbi:MAG: hypothetical protein QOG60_2731 [Frankiaceae bacterium]|jgi:cell division protein FtsB|nr:hypothetical protein [Frankiaceae bacterium]
MTTRGPVSPERRAATRRTATPAPAYRRGASAGAGRRDVRGATARPNRAAAPRPAIRRPSSRSTRSTPTTDARARLTVTTRAALLALTVCLVALTMAYPLRAYVSQKAGIAELQAQQRVDQQAVLDLQRQVARYQNPTSVQDEARLRLHYQLPGEKIFLLPPTPAPVAPPSDKVHTPALPDQAAKPWYSQLWGSAVETSK